MPANTGEARGIHRGVFFAGKPAPTKANVHSGARFARATLAAIFSVSVDSPMLPPKALLDALSEQASRLFSSDAAQPRAELESQFKVLMQGTFSKLDLVSRDEFDSQMVVLARTRARLEALEKQVAELEARLNPTSQDE